MGAPDNKRRVLRLDPDLDPVAHRRSSDPPGMKRGRVARRRRHRGRPPSWCARARFLVGPGAPRAPPLVPRPDRRPGARFPDFPDRGPTPAARREEGAMEVLYPRCAGLDVHKATVVAGVRLVAGGKVVREVRTFGTTTAGLLELAAWLGGSGCTHVAMEATGVYWRPVWHVLAEGGFGLVL